ncbi:MAG: hypothetical protein JSU63_19695 [Phycisphaerales bacterium]|nr:MAG: hypothetical protein JSU63_19695 [Phycisphaerales bacterium]
MSEQQVCVFCHAPHKTSGQRPLWNRESSITSYQIYQSSTLDANAGQPTGSSKLCLSCHDGTIALGSVLSRADRILMVGSDYLPVGLTNLDTDLSDDHPVSFYYTAGLAAVDQQLVIPQSLPPEITLDAQNQLQCTACHDPHSNVNGDFLVVSNVYGALCTACHTMDGWMPCSHQTSGAVVSGSTTVDWPYTTVEENACRSCHRPHTAGGRERLLLFESEEDNCLDCHDGQIALTNMLVEIQKFWAHDPRRYTQVHDPVELPVGGEAHVECEDCHNPHAVQAQGPVSSYIPIGATMTSVRGVTIGGTPIDEADYEYEICFRCHGDNPVPVSQQIVRQVHTSNHRLRFSPINESFHPVAAPSPNSDTVSLVPEIAPGSLMRCTDCHNNDAGPRAGGAGPDGPHGSNFNFLLERNYTVLDDTHESEYEYALCYKCHLRSSIIGNQSFSHHLQHLRGASSAPCSVCHDPHGVNGADPYSSDHTHLINFDMTVVFPETQSGRMQFEDLGTHTGRCTLRCHGRNHVDTNY